MGILGLHRHPPRETFFQETAVINSLTLDKCSIDTKFQSIWSQSQGNAWFQKLTAGTKTFLNFSKNLYMKLTTIFSPTPKQEFIPLHYPPPVGIQRVFACTQKELYFKHS